MLIWNPHSENMSGKIAIDQGVAVGREWCSVATQLELLSRCYFSVRGNFAFVTFNLGPIYSALRIQPNVCLMLGNYSN